MFSFFGSYNYVFQSVYGFNQRQIGLTFLGILVGFLFAIATFGIFDATLYRKAATRAKGMPAPEHRLYAAMLGSFLLPIGLFWFAWAPMKDVHWIVPVLAGVPFGWGCLAIFVSFPPSLLRMSTNLDEDRSNDIPRRRLPICQWCLRCCCERNSSIWSRWCFPSIYSSNV